MRVTVFSAKPYDRAFLEAANSGAHDLSFVEVHLTEATAKLADGSRAVCAFVNDELHGEVLKQLTGAGVELVALRCAGFNHVDLAEAHRLGMTVARVPAYSPHAVAEHAVALLLSLNRKIHRAYARVREANFALTGLVGFDLHGKTVGVIGTGKIGHNFCRIVAGFGCSVVAVDQLEDPDLMELGVRYVELDQLLAESDVISLHCPLTKQTAHLIDDRALRLTKPGVVLINTGRGGLVDTKALIESLKTGHLGGVGLDVYEEEEDLFFEDLSAAIIQDDVFMRLLTFPNVLITAHQGFFTKEALQNIAETTVANLTAFESGTGQLHQVTLAQD